MSINSISRTLISDIERGNWRDFNLQIKIFQKLKETLFQREDELEEDLRRRYQVLKSNYDFDLSLNQKSIICKRKHSNQEGAKRLKCDSRNRFNNDIFYYKKGQYRTAGLVPTMKTCLGAGFNGKVFQLNASLLKVQNPDSPLLKTSKTLVVKKTNVNTLGEFRIGQLLSHKNLVKSYYFFIKEYPSKCVYKIVMEEVNGTALEDIISISIESCKKYLNNIKHCCLYLFDQEYFWTDRHSSNVIIELESDELKFIDFNDWQNENHPKTLHFNLLLPSLEMVKKILSKSKLQKKTNSIIDYSKLSNLADSASTSEARVHLESAFDKILNNLEVVLLDPSLYPDDDTEESSSLMPSEENDSD